jgi:hypothetical protein
VANQVETKKNLGRNEVKPRRWALTTL